MPKRKSETPEKSPLKLLLWTALAGVIFGLIEFGEIAEDLLRASRNSLHKHDGSGNIVLVKFDDESLKEVGRWPWPRRNYAALTDKLSAAQTSRIFFDLVLDAPTNPTDDAIFADALQRSGNVTLAVLPRSGPDRVAEGSQDLLPLRSFATHAKLASIEVRYNWQNAAWRVPYSSKVGQQIIPTFSAALARRSGEPGSSFVPDYSTDLKSIPTFSASDVLYGRVPAAAFKGKDVIIGVASGTIGDQFFLPGTGRMPGAYVHVIGAETLKSGKPRHFGWLPLYLVALAAAACAVWQRSGYRRAAVLAAALGILLFGPVLFETRLVTLDVMPAVFVLLTVSIVLGWRGFRKRGLVNEASGLLNLAALRNSRSGRSQTLIAARVMNYAEIVSTLPAESEGQLVEQIVSRLKVGASDRVLYQGDGGIFAWFEETRLPIANHVEALHALFRNPAKVAGVSVDLSVAFGVEIGSSRSLASRLASALVAADEAAHDGLKWKYHDPDTLQDASWKLSMLSQLDDAVDKGEVWVAYQPKLDLVTRKIVGAEALARWTHPEKGPIAASEFVAAAEQHNRIAKLTDFVLDKAIAAGAAINRTTPGFEMAVNLSARLLTDQALILRLGAMLARHGLNPRLLTLELTETATLADSGAAIDMLSSLREIGVGISIDDYGTGLSTLDYLKKIPANEIKIDQSFVKGVVDNRSDRLMVQSTIGLAHSLGRKVVAEGVERREILDALVDMGCDIAQGYVIGRPMGLDSLVKRIGGRRKPHVA